MDRLKSPIGPRYKLRAPRAGFVETSELTFTPVRGYSGKMSRLHASNGELFEHPVALLPASVRGALGSCCGVDNERGVHSQYNSREAIGPTNKFLDRGP
jgi:hypothetical protein